MSDLSPEALAEWREVLDDMLNLARGHDYADAKELARGEDVVDEVFDALAAEKARAEQAEHTAGQLRTALTESRSVWKARAEQAEEDARIERLSSAAHARMADDLAGQLEQAERERDEAREQAARIANGMAPSNSIRALVLQMAEDAEQEALDALSDLRAAVKALADEWFDGPSKARSTWQCARELRALLAEHRAETDADNGGGEGQ